MGLTHYPEGCLLEGWQQRCGARQGSPRSDGQRFEHGPGPLWAALLSQLSCLRSVTEVLPDGEEGHERGIGAHSRCFDIQADCNLTEQNALELAPLVVVRASEPTNSVTPNKSTRGMNDIHLLCASGQPLSSFPPMAISATNKEAPPWSSPLDTPGVNTVQPGLGPPQTDTVIPLLLPS